jgi:hypothetical protein
MKADPADMGPEATPESASVCRTAAGVGTCFGVNVIGRGSKPTGKQDDSAYRDEEP